MTYHLQSVLKQNSIYGNINGKYLKKKMLYPLIPQRKFFHMLINIQVLIKIMGTLPVTSCECERSISMLQLVKSPLRNTMTQDRLNALAMILYHQDVMLNPEEVVEKFA